MSQPAPRVGPAALAYAGAEVGARLGWFGVVAILGCTLSRRDFGAWGLLMALAGLLEIGLTLGLHGPATRWRFDQDDEAYRRVLFTLLTLWLGASTLAVLGLDALGGWGFALVVDALPWRPEGRLALGLAWVGAASAVPLAVLAARQQALRWAWLRVATVLGPAAGVGVALLLGHASPRGILLGQLLGALLPAIVALVAGLAGIRPGLTRIRPLLAFALPVLPHMMAWWVLSWSDRWLLARLRDLEAVAIYHWAYLPALGALLAGGAINKAWYPLLYRQLEDLDRVERREGAPAFSSAGSTAAPTSAEGRAILATLSTQARAVQIGLVCAGAGVALWAGELLRLLPTKGYDQSPSLVAFTVAGTTIGLLYLLPHNLLFHQRRTGPIPWMTGVAALANLLLNLALIPPLGPLGAAMATVLAYALLAGLFHRVANRLARPLIPGPALLTLLAPGALALALAMLIAVLAPPWPLRLGLEVAGSAALVVTLARIGAFGTLRALLRAR